MVKTQPPPRQRLTIRYRARRYQLAAIERWTCTNYELTPGWAILHNAQQHDWDGRPRNHPTHRHAIPTHRIAQLTQH
ncbi:hypothetical protein [Micromonospora humi]|uniref:Uncharacterized protein n=1 Tax=Micromonospora humi TaxID=745366 RepID=A0A1C5HLH0_9ACTN|nr:hypothetical protein [Micromonospora humi]SCG46835.1 hypothetical protein GA0070213_103284 [Micromonospora humi]